MKILSTIVVLAALACAPTIKMQTWKGQSTDPMTKIDSLGTSHGLSIPDYHKWVKAFYYDNEDNRVEVSNYVTRKGKVDYIFTVTKSSADSLYVVKLRIEP